MGIGDAVHQTAQITQVRYFCIDLFLRIGNVLNAAFYPFHRLIYPIRTDSAAIR